MGLLDDQIEQELNEAHFCRKSELEAMRRQKQERDAYKWKGRVSVSNISSLRDCPKKLVETAKSKGWYPNKRQRAVFDMGHIIHDFYQQRALKAPGLLAPKPQNVPEDLKKTAEEIWPEVPMGFYYKGTRVIGAWADGVQLKDKKISVVELKHTERSAEDFLTRFEEAIHLKKHDTQLKIYMYLLKKSNYYPGASFTKGELIYVSTDVANGEAKREKSLWIPLTAEDEEMLDDMMPEIGRQCLEGGDCNYKFCRDHS
jgi:CRISPR/Cas system-associated exonuclease Cas4 (RecB family)